MPLIPIYERKERIQPQPGLTLDANAVARQQVGPFQQLAAGLEDATDRMFRRDDEDAQIDAAKRWSGFQLQWLNEFETRKQNAEPGAPGFVDTFRKDYDSALNEFRGTFKTNLKAQQFVEQNSASFTTSLGHSVATFASQAEVAKRKTDFQETTDNYAKMVRSDPTKADMAVQELDNTLRNMGIPPVQQEALRKWYRAEIGQHAVLARVENNPWQAVKDLKAGTFDNLVTADAKDKLIRSGIAEQRHRTAEARQAEALNLAKAQGLAQNYIAQLQVNKDAPPPPDLSYDKLVANLGQKAADNLSVQLDQARIVGEDTALLKTMLPEARKQYLQELTNAVGAKPDGAALAMNRLQHATAAVQNIEKEFADDPAQYGIKNNPTVAANAQQFFNAWGSADTTPERKQELWNQYKASQEGYQRSQGLTSPALMSKPLAEKLASTIDQAKDPGEAANNLKALHAIMGNDAPMVLSQISKHIPPTMIFAADMENRPGSELVNAIRMHKEVDKTLTPDQKKAVGEKVISQTEDVRGVLTQYTNGPALMAGLNDAVSSYAKYLVFKEGISEDAAAEKAFKHVWSDNFNVHKTFYVPKKEDTGALDVGADRIVKALDPSQLRRSTDYPYVANNSELENQQALASSLKSKYSIVTTEDRKGVYVLYGSGQHVMLKQEGKPSGVPLVLTWQQLRTAEPAKIPGTWEFPE